MSTKSLKSFWLVIIVAGIFGACNSDYTPRQKGYFKIEFPPHEYRTFDSAGYPYTFEYPVYAVVRKDSTFFGDETENGYWINIEFPSFQSRIYISYKEVGKTDFTKLVNDAFKMTFK